MSDAPSLPAADRVAVVVNGNAKQVSGELVDVLDQIVRSGDLFVSRSIEEGKEIARRIVEQGYHTVLTGGGDGTFTQMVTWCVGAAEELELEPPRFGFLRLGTGNALAWVLGAQRGRTTGVVSDLGRLRSQGGSRRLRLVEVEGVLSPFAGLGADAMALNHYEETRDQLSKIPGVRRFAAGGLSYAIAILGKSSPEVLFKTHPCVTIRNLGGEALKLGVDGQPISSHEAGEVIYQGPARGVWASTIPYGGFGVRLFPFAEDRDDKVHLRVVDIGPADMVWNIRSIWKGTYRDDRVHDFLVDRVVVEAEPPMAFQIGGDALGERERVEISLSRAINVVDYYAPPPVR